MGLAGWLAVALTVLVVTSVMCFALGTAWAQWFQRRGPHWWWVTVLTDQEVPGSVPFGDGLWIATRVGRAEDREVATSMISGWVDSLADGGVVSIDGCGVHALTR